MFSGLLNVGGFLRFFDGVPADSPPCTCRFFPPPRLSSPALLLRCDHNTESSDTEHAAFVVAEFGAAAIAAHAWNAAQAVSAAAVASI